MSRATIRDVAKLAKVSASTVSHVVNKTRVVAPETIERVEAAMSELGYLPSGIAQALRAQSTKTIGMIVTTTTNPYFAAVIHGVESGCSARGFSLILANCGDELSLLTEHVRTLVAKRIDGLIVMTTNSSQDFFEHLPKWRVPMVAIDTHHEGIMCSINDDSYLGARLVAKLFVERQVGPIAYIAGPYGHPRSEKRLSGFRDGLAEWGRELDFNWVVRGADLTIADGHAAAVSLVENGFKHGAIFACNDLMAVGVLSALHGCSLRVPDDVSVVGYDDIEFAAYTIPPLTTVHQPAPDIGARAADILIDYLENGRQLEPEVVLAPTLIERGSVIPARLVARPD